jgi:hypothetical protein
LYFFDFFAKTLHKTLKIGEVDSKDDFMKNTHEFEIKKELEELVVLWLQNKINFLQVDKKLPFWEFINKYASLLIESRVYHGDLEAAPFYIRFENKQKIIYNFPKNHRHTFKNFNYPVIGLIYDMLKIKDDVDNFNKSSTNEKINMLLMQQFEMKNTTLQNNNFANFSKYESVFLKYSDIVEKLDNKLYKDFISYPIDKEYNFKEYESTLFNYISNNSREFKNMYMFFPCKLDQDILSDKNYLFEINNYKFQRANIGLKTQIDRFYELYGFNSKASAEIFPLENYFLYSGMVYKDEFAYFDPFKMLKVHSEDFMYVINHIKEKKTFIYKLFDLLNKIQFDSIIRQQDNLINSIGLSKYYNRFEIFLTKQIEIVTHVEDSEYKQLFLKALHTLSDGLKRFNGNITKNTNIEDIPLENCDQEVKNAMKYILNKFQEYKGKKDLNYMYKHYLTYINEFANNYNLNKKQTETLQSILINLITLYDENPKLKKGFNFIFEKSYNNYKKRDIDKLIKLNEEIRFISRYKQEFNTYRPLDLSKLDIVDLNQKSGT